MKDELQDGTLKAIDVLRAYQWAALKSNTTLTIERGSEIRTLHEDRNNVVWVTIYQIFTFLFVV